MGADAAAGAPRLLRWGAHLLLLGAIAVLFVNSSPFLAEPWQDVLLLALAPLVVAAVLLRDRLPYALPALGILALAGGTVAVAMVGIATMTIRRSGPAVWLLVGAAAASLTALTVARELESGPVGIAIAVGIGLVMVVLAPVAIGRYIRAHDRLEASAAEASARAEIERELAARDAAHAERERIAREMHDGLGHALGTAEALLEEDPDRARRLIAQARDDSSAALAELRDLMRGIRPPILADRGLGAALEALALDAVTTVTADVDLPDGLDPALESAVYFATRELVTNALKHARASRVALHARLADGRLIVTVADDGSGGAVPVPGRGLDGVGRRLAAFDGTLALVSPAGGPTTARIEVPCAS